MRQFSNPIPWMFFLSGAILLLFLGLTACGTGKRLSEASNSIELRAAMEAAGEERIAWRMAKKLDSFEGYRNFLLLFPEGKYSAQARARLQAYEAALWDEVRWALDEEKRICDYLLIKYLDLYPDGQWAFEAQDRLRDLWQSAPWYSAGFGSYEDAAGVLEPQAKGAVSIHDGRLAGMAEYLDRFPQGVLAELMAERLARTYIGYRVLPAEGVSALEEIALEPAEVEAWASALSNLTGLNESKAGRAEAYLRSALKKKDRLNLLDADHNSIPDELELPELTGPKRRDMLYVPTAGTEDEHQDGVVLPGEGTDPGEYQQPGEIIPETVEPAPDNFEETDPGELPNEVTEVIDGSTTEEAAISLEDMAERTAESISQGQFLYDSIPTLIVNDPFFFQLMIISSTDPVPGGVRRGRVRPRRIPITSEMAVNIQPADPEAFTINSLSASHQPVFPGDTTVWSWNVIPRKSGTHQVAITIDIVTTGPTSGEPLKKNITVFNEKVQVKAIEKPVPVADNAGGEQDTGFGLYPWLLLLLPVAALGFFLIKRRGRESTATPATGQPFGKENPQQRTFLLSNRTAILDLLNQSERAIAKGDTRQAIEKLETFFNDRHYPIHQQLVTLAAQLNKYQREFNLGLKPDDSIPNRVNMALLELINRIHEVVDEG